MKDITIQEEKKKVCKKAILVFPLRDEFEKVDFARCLAADDMAGALWDVQQEIFRPARKHGYQDKDIRELIEKIGVDKDGGSMGCELIGLLETKYYALMEKHGVDINELYL